MSRPLVGLEEEPSELERLCLRVREAVAAQEEAAAQRGGGAEYWNGESSSDCGSADSGCESDSEGEVTPRAAPAQALRFAGAGGPSKQLPLLHPAGQEPPGALYQGLGLDKAFESALPQPLICAAAPAKCTVPANALGCVDEDDSLHQGLGLLYGTLKLAASSPHNLDKFGGACSGALRQASTSSGEGSAFGAVSLQSGASDMAAMSLRAYSNGLGTLKEAGTVPGGQGSGRVADDLLFDFDEGARNGHSAAHTPTRGVSPVSPKPFL